MYSLIFIILAAVFKSVMDVLQFHYYKSWFYFKFYIKLDWWNPANSWTNKYKDHDMTKGPAFFGATTFLCWITDAWHFFQFCFLNSIFLAIILFKPIAITNIWIWNYILIFIIYKIVFSFVFEQLFKKLSRN